MIKSINIGFIYGMIIGLTIGLFKVPYKVEESDGYGTTVSTFVNFLDYLVPLIRVILVIGILGAIVGLGIYVLQNKKLFR